MTHFLDVESQYNGEERGKYVIYVMMNVLSSPEGCHTSIPKPAENTPCYGASYFHVFW